MKHKLVIYGNNMYKEVDFDDSFAGSITIGTDKACQIAFRKDRFMTGFIFRIDRQADGDKTKFLKLYDQMKQKIINNPEMLYKDYWKI